MDDDTKRTVWERVKEALNERGFPATQAKAAELAGVKQPSVSDWNKPGGYPEMGSAIQLAKRLGYCVEWIVTGRGPRRVVDIQELDAVLEQVLVAWPDLNDQSRREIASMAKFKISYQTEPEPIAVTTQTHKFIAKQPRPIERAKR